MLLAIDYGAKRIGLSIADEKAGIPLPLKELPNKGLEEVAKEVERIIKQENISTVVVGLPLNLAGEETLKTQETKKFIDFLTGKISSPVVAFDERLTSKLADALSGGGRGSRDVGAAMIILEDYLKRKGLYDSQS